MSELEIKKKEGKTAWITIKYKYRKGKKNLSENRAYEYDPDESWEKWREVLFNPMGKIDLVKWYKDNVIIGDNLSFMEVIQLVGALEKKFMVTDKELKKLLKNCGKVARGISVPGFHQKAIEFTVLSGMNGSITYDHIPKVSFKDMLFWKRMIDQEAISSKEQVKKLKQQKKK